jgi:hypothetical protein
MLVANTKVYIESTTVNTLITKSGLPARASDKRGVLHYSQEEFIMIRLRTKSQSELNYANKMMLIGGVVCAALLLLNWVF